MPITLRPYIFFSWITSNAKGQFLLAAEVLMRLQAVARDAEDGHAQGLEFRVHRGELHAFTGASRSGVFRVKVQNQGFADQCGAVDLLAVGGDGAKAGQ